MFKTFCRFWIMMFNALCLILAHTKAFPNCIKLLFFFFPLNFTMLDTIQTIP